MDYPGAELRSGPALILSTRKGVFFLQPDASRSKWRLSDPVFLGHIVNHTVLDPRDGRTLLAAARTGHLGPTVFRSTDSGRTWREAVRPPAFDKAEDGAQGRTVSHTFWLSAGHASERDTWWAGTSPQALWHSADGGATWESCRGFNDHPDYSLRTEDPQGGTPDGPVLHSILIDPRDARHMYFGLSGGGVYETRDRGETWSPLNRGMASPLGDPNATPDTSIPLPEVGPHFDPHCVQMHPLRPDLLYQQNHVGIYRLERPGDTWDRVGRSMPADVGDIGFPIALHPRDPDTCWVFPMDGTDVWPRTSPGGRPSVYVTHDGGSTWSRQDRGLPERAWYTVKRQCMSVDAANPVGVYFGTTCGDCWASIDEGTSWTALARGLPEIYAVETAELA
jgi:photosystem II stability/assembly factor-like uncharacterized protein